MDIGTGLAIMGLCYVLNSILHFIHAWTYYKPKDDLNERIAKIERILSENGISD